MTQINGIAVKRKPFASIKRGEGDWNPRGRNEWDRTEAHTFCQHKKKRGEWKLTRQKVMGSRSSESHLPSQKDGRGIGTQVAEINGIAMKRKPFANTKKV